MDNPTDHLAAVRAAPVTNQNDHLTAVRAALDLMLRVWPGSLDVRRFVDDAGNDAAAVIDKATGETIAICDNEDRDDHAAPAEDAAAIVALRNAATAIAALADECERLRKELDVAADCGIMRGRSWETTEWEAATGFRSKLEARRALAAFRIACAEATRDADIADAARRLLGEE